MLTSWLRLSCLWAPGACKASFGSEQDSCLGREGVSNWAHRHSAEPVGQALPDSDPCHLRKFTIFPSRSHRAQQLSGYTAEIHGRIPPAQSAGQVRFVGESRSSCLSHRMASANWLHRGTCWYLLCGKSCREDRAILSTF